MKFVDISGKIFNYIKVIRFHHKEYKSANNVEYYWECECLGCGKHIIVSRRALQRGRKSCGCMSRVSHNGSNYHLGVKSHGMSKTRFYKIYRKMIERCYKTSGNTYECRNIQVCDEWLGSHGFEHFKKDMYNSYILHTEKFGEENTSIDRVNNDGDYSKTNCKWSTLKERANNKSNNIVIEFNGVNKTLAEWAEYLGWNYYTLMNRYRRGWSVERILTEEPRFQKKSRKYRANQCVKSIDGVTHRN